MSHAGGKWMTNTVPYLRFEWATVRLAYRMLWRLAQQNPDVLYLYNCPKEWEKLQAIFRRACLPAAKVRLAKRIWRRNWVIEGVQTPQDP
jgi:hypothetical protein